MDRGWRDAPPGISWLFVWEKGGRGGAGGGGSLVAARPRQSASGTVDPHQGGPSAGALAFRLFPTSLGATPMSTGLDTFDKTVQESNLWLKDVMERLNTNDRHHAYSTLRAVLHALRDRIGPESAAHLGAQLPMLLRGLFYEGWDPTGKPSKERHEAAFLAHIARELPRADEAEMEQGAY